MWLAGRKDIQSVKVTWSILHSKLKNWALPPLEENSKGRKRNTQIKQQLP